MEVRIGEPSELDRRRRTEVCADVVAAVKRRQHAHRPGALVFTTLEQGRAGACCCRWRCRRTPVPRADPPAGPVAEVRASARVRSEATILHADADSFYASVEQRDDPGLRGRPVIVGAGVVLAASYEAKAYGVRTPMGGALARRLCPQAIVVRPRIDAYSQASKAMFEVFVKTTPLVEGISIDEAFLDVGGLRLFGHAHRDRRATAPGRARAGRAPVSVGVASTKFLAKVASAVAKPDGLLVVPRRRGAGVPAPAPGGAPVGCRAGHRDQAP